MDFLKRHYEKVILLGLFVFFIGLMYLVQTVIDSTREVTEADLALPQRTPDYEQVVKEGSEFDTAKLWADSHLKWDHIANNKNGNDFVSVRKMARCPFCSKKGDGGAFYSSVIPLTHFSDGKCPECNHDLKKPWGVDVDYMVEKFQAQDAEKLKAEEGKRQQAEEQRRVEEEKRREEDERKRVEDVKRERDRDGDGIINADEVRFGMDENDPHDARYDNDGDGFSNIFELENGYWPNKPLDHPPLWWRLRVKDVRKFELDVKFMALNDSGSPDKKNWMVQFNHPDPNPRRKGRMTSTYLYIGSTLHIDGRTYRVADIERVVTEKKRAASALEAGEKGEVVEKVDESRVTMVEVVRNGGEPEKLVFVINQVAYSNDYRPVLEDTGRLTGKNREFTRRIGEMFKMGLFKAEKDSEEKLTRKQLLGEVRSYRIKSVDVKKMVVQIEEVLPPNSKEKPQTFVITKEGKVPAKQTPIKKVQSQGSNEEDVLRQDAPVVQGTAGDEGDKKKTPGEEKIDPNAPRKPLIGTRPTDGSPRQSMFENEEKTDAADDLLRSFGR